MIIEKARNKDVRKVAELALLLWEDNTLGDMIEDMELNIGSETAAVFLALDNNDTVGFAQCQLRTDYVEGTHNSPVGYLEGIFIKNEYRHKGVAKALLSKCETWTKEQGCTEFASDCELDNIDSLNHKGKITSYDHDKIGAELARKFLIEFIDDEMFIEKVVGLIRWHMQILFVVNNLPYSDVKTMKKQTDIKEVALLGLCDRLGRLEANRSQEESNIKMFLQKCRV